jgi:hypothetical protein
MKNNTEDHSDQTSATSSHPVSYDQMEASSHQHEAINISEEGFPDHKEVQHTQPTELMRLTAKAKEGLRKGKWTPEEELYTNKVIEVFNAGLLKLSDNERGITLRAYLAEKLHCDPMRITKKYTGASCLGKRVFHFDYQHADHAEAERARQELQLLEHNFRMKLEVINKKRMCDPRSSVDGAYSVTTPAIDALLHRNHNNNNYNNMMMPMLFPPGMNLPTFEGSAVGYPTAASTFFAAAAAQFQHQQQQQPARPHFLPVSSGLYTQILAEAGKGSSEITLVGPKGAPFLRGPNGEIFFPPPGFGPLHFMPPSQHARGNGQQQYPYFAPHLSTMMATQQHHPHDPIHVPIASAADLRLPLFPSMGKVPSWKDLSATSNNASASMPISQLTASGNDHGDEHKDKRPRVIKSRSDPKLLAEFGSQENLFNVAALEDLTKQIETAESDQNEAASSLLGFINHVRRNSSQEDLLEFFEGVQKTIDNSSPQGTKSASYTALNNNNNLPVDSGGSTSGKIPVK